METVSPKDSSLYTFNFASSGTLARQIERGAPAKVFISASTMWTERLAERGLIQPSDTFSWLSNTLVWVVPTQSALNSLDALWTENGRLSIGDPRHVPLGHYTQQALERLELWGDIKANVLPAPHARAALLAVEMGECKGGIVYKTDAIASNKVKILERIDAQFHDPIRYDVMSLDASNTESQRFIEILQSEATQHKSQQLGFEAR
jgi:molybdate transport system substrate-binding protein